MRLEPPLALALAPPLLLLLLLPPPLLLLLAAFTFAATLVAPAAVLSVLVPAESEAEDCAALETEVDAATAVSTLVLLATPAAALSVLVPAAMLALETEVDAPPEVSTLVETPFWPEPPLNLAALVWRMLAQRANTYGDL